MAKTRTKKHIEESCYDLAVKRVELCFDKFDKVVVSFSGGKDSTACLNIAIEASRRRGQLPLDVLSFDEEAIPPDTVDYMRRVSQLPEIRFHWYCIPVQHRNACSEKQPYWYPWLPDDREKWVRDLPPEAITELRGFKLGMAIPQASPLVFGPSNGTVCAILGIRCQESMSRFRMIAQKPKQVTDDAFLTRNSDYKWITHAYPIYDWNTEDVWRAPLEFGWDYNTAYDVMEKAGVSRHNQRCAPPFGEQPIRGLHKFKTCWPELWGKMTQRVAGAATAARYANTGLYACGMSDDDLPAGKTWQQHTLDLVGDLHDSAKPEVAKAISQLMAEHSGRTADPMPDAEPHEKSGFCWKYICQVAKVGGNKFGRQTQKINMKAIAARRKRGILS
jgi:predicted phosphoadenosine phosphosulfate sulfurtransferase